MKEKTFIYETPIVEVLNVEVEKGFAVSAGTPDWQDGGNIGDAQQNAIPELNDLLNDF